ncbi:LysR family transcriptional regulator [Neobacillus mesonae]|uniref:LysR family transcriptional regulator n=1 Tax=Neobacillus mesonae TaxID=1193713 RepID=A0A3Q9QUN9_9BACI|nr:LysR family transcriptional regulator [Neobacillus mesonae]AZU62680.1 LysR family transcriptional regulator [Neobacillus mesonae]
MDIRQLRYFVVIAEEKQLTRAAERLHMAQPPLSRQLKLLEEELGATLFERNGRSMNLTEAGKLLYIRAESILNQLNETITEIKDTGEGLKGVLSIGTIHTCIPVLSEKIRYFQEKYPLVNFRIYEESPSILSEQLEKREIELAIIRSPFKKDIFSIHNLPEEPFVLVMPAQWQEANTRTTIMLNEFKNLPLLLLKKGKSKERSYHQMFIDECDKIGVELNIVCECPDAAFLLMLVKAGIGATILPKSFVTFKVDEYVKLMDILDFPCQSESSVIWLKERQLSKSASRFIETFQST